MIYASESVEIILAQVFPVIKSSSAHFNEFYTGCFPVLYNRDIEMRSWERVSDTRPERPAELVNTLILANYALSELNIGKYD